MALKFIDNSKKFLTAFTTIICLDSLLSRTTISDFLQNLTYKININYPLMFIKFP